MNKSAQTVLSIGQCRPDQAAITHFLTSNFDVQVLASDSMQHAIDVLRSQQVDLVLINRKLDADYSDGMEILKYIRSQPEWKSVSVMLVSNFPEWQEKAVALGAVTGFGKAELNQLKTRERIATALKTQTPAPVETL